MNQYHHILFFEPLQAKAGKLRCTGLPGAGGGKRLKAPKGRQHHPFALKLYLCGTFFAAGKSLSRFFLNNPSVHMGKTVL
jgi:hypothetical protein